MHKLPFIGKSIIAVLIMAAPFVLRQVFKRKLKQAVAIRDAILNNIDEGILLIDKDLKIIWANAKERQLYGDIAGEFCYRATHNLNSPCSGQQHACPIQEALKSGKASTVAHEHLDQYGNKHFIEITVYPIKNEAGEITEFIHIGKDITEREIINGELRKLGRSIEQSPSTVMITDAKGNIEYVNPHFTKLTGYAASEVIGKNPRILQSGMTPPEVYKEMRKALSLGGEWNGEIYNKKKNGEFFWESESISSLKDSEGNITHYILVGEDITRRKQAEEGLRLAYAKLKETQSMLIQSEKMEVVGRLSSGVAHEVKNPLGIILQGIFYIKQRLQSADHDSVAVLKDMEEAVKRADNIVRGLLDFSRVSELTLAQEDINVLIEQTLSLLKSQILQQQIKVNKYFQGDIPGIRVDKNKIEQVFVNLIMNAIYAMPDGGELTVRTFTKQLSASDDAVGNRRGDVFRPQETVVVAEVEDTGSGIPEGILDKIFEPFFTTWRAKGGTGLGLPIIKNIIEMHNGRIGIANRLDTRGARVTVIFKL